MHRPNLYLVRSDSYHQLIESLQKAIQTSQKQHTPGGFLYVAIDNLPMVMSGLGESEAEDMIAELLRDIPEAFHTVDGAFRLDRDHIGLIVPQCTLSDLQHYTAKLYQWIRQYGCEHSASPLQLTATIGGALFPDMAHSAQEAIDKAYIATSDARENAHPWPPERSPFGVDQQAMLDLGANATGQSGQIGLGAAGAPLGVVRVGPRRGAGRHGRRIVEDAMAAGKLLVGVVTDPGDDQSGCSLEQRGRQEVEGRIPVEQVEDRPTSLRRGCLGNRKEEPRCGHVGSVRAAGFARQNATGEDVRRDWRREDFQRCVPSAMRRQRGLRGSFAHGIRSRAY